MTVSRVNLLQQWRVHMIKVLNLFWFELLLSISLLLLPQSAIRSGYCGTIALCTKPAFQHQV